MVRKQIVVQAPIERAFAVFTERFGDFKPPEHNLLARPIAETVFEPEVGGHIYDRASTAANAAGRAILAYEPPQRVVFSWDIGPQWQIETDPDQTSEVEVRFVAETPDRTRVELEHRHIDRHGPGWQAVSDGVDGDQGWPLYLARYAALFTRQTEWHRSSPASRSTGPQRMSSSYATDPTRFDQWQKGVVDGRMDHGGTPQVGDRCLTTRRIGGANRQHVHGHPRRPTPHLGRPRHRRTDPRHRRPHRRTAHRDTVRLTIAVDFTGHGIGKVLVPLLVRREAQQEMPSNLALLKQRLEAPTS